jgi:MHS family proline/betaine transporter-like MFS transporter
MRLIRGFSAGGEMGVGTMIHENMAAKRRNFIFGLHNISSYISSLAAPGLSAVLTMTLGQSGMADGGWRVLFLISLPLGLVGLYLRLKIVESPAFLALQKRASCRKLPSGPYSAPSDAPWRPTSASS